MDENSKNLNISLCSKKRSKKIFFYIYKLFNTACNSDIDMNDAYLLDEEDDDEQEYAKELTIDQLLELEGNDKNDKNFGGNRRFCCSFFIFPHCTSFKQFHWNSAQTRFNPRNSAQPCQISVL